MSAPPSSAPTKSGISRGSVEPSASSITTMSPVAAWKPARSAAPLPARELEHDPRRPAGTGAATEMVSSVESPSTIRTSSIQLGIRSSTCGRFSASLSVGMTTLTASPGLVDLGFGLEVDLGRRCPDVSGYGGICRVQAVGFDRHECAPNRAGGLGPDLPDLRAPHASINPVIADKPECKERSGRLRASTANGQTEFDRASPAVPLPSFRRPGRGCRAVRSRGRTSGRARSRRTRRGTGGWCRSASRSRSRARAWPRRSTRRP